MRISGIEITDTLGTKQAKFRPGTVTRIHGANGSGKSSIIKALLYIFEGGTSPEIIRKEADQSRVEITLDDGTTISKVTRPKRGRKGGDINGYTVDLEITQPDGQPRNAPQTYLKELGEATAIDPATLLRFDATTVPGRRALAEQLMKLVPIAFTPEEVERACAYRSTIAIPRGSGDALALSQQPTESVNLDELKKLSAYVTEERRRAGITKSDTDGAINRLQKALPEGNASDRSKELAETEDFRRTVDKAIADERVVIEKQAGDFVSLELTKSKDAIALVDREAQEAIRKIQADASDKKAALVAAFEGIKEVAANQKQGLLDQLDADSKPELEKAIAEVERLKAQVEAQTRAVTLKQEIEVQLIAHRSASWKYDELSGVLQRLEAMRIQKLKNLPVPGLDFEDGFPRLDGIEWQNVNLARRVEAVLQICCQQTGKLPLILIDDCEHLSLETRTLIEQGLIESGYQVMECIVSDGPLTIETIGTNEPVAA